MNNSSDVQKLELIRALPYFSELLEVELVAVVEKMVEGRFDVGQTLTEQGQVDSEVYFICSGLARVYIVTQDGKEKTLSLLGPGSILGEVASVAGGERTAYAEALTDIRALKINRADFISLIREDSDLAINIIRGLSERLRKSISLVEESTSFGLADRLLIVLRKFASELKSNEVNVSHEELARITGAGRARVTEALNEMQEQGLLEIGRRTIRLKSQETSQE